MMLPRVGLTGRQNAASGNGSQPKQRRCSVKSFKDIENQIGSIPAIRGGNVTDDNIAIALATYFSDLPECPENDYEDRKSVV